MRAPFLLALLAACGARQKPPIPDDEPPDAGVVGAAPDAAAPLEPGARPSRAALGVAFGKADIPSLPRLPALQPTKPLPTEQPDPAPLPSITAMLDGVKRGEVTLRVGSVDGVTFGMRGNLLGGSGALLENGFFRITQVHEHRCVATLAGPTLPPASAVIYR
ncbi:MAG: hypothetical protein ABI867_22300 [Kofleriaceae bacterium]